MAKPPSPTIRIASWNIHSCVGTDGIFAPDRIAETLREIDADIIGLQEVGYHHRGQKGFDQFTYLADALGLSIQKSLIKNCDQNHYGIALLTRFPVEQTTELNITIGRREPRSALCNLVKLPLGHKISILNAHFGLDPIERFEQAKLITKYLSISGNKEYLLMGDLNEWRDTSRSVRHLSHFFPTMRAPRSFPSQLPFLRLDRIYASEDFSCLQAHAYHHARTKHASDHLPIWADFSLKPQSKEEE